ncbi:hypothetical protein NEOC65_000873 [Neochlamydia sp. AcF65]|nr:hypothetical protein [Neochlamydia sp. AcF65]MBS4171582.1 hypothetical protein [Neochlamydia sp. AcF95]
MIYLFKSFCRVGLKRLNEYSRAKSGSTKEEEGTDKAKRT